MNTSFGEQQSCHGSISMAKESINELLQGQEKTVELKALLCDRYRLVDGCPTSLLINEVLGSFDRAISLLKSEQGGRMVGGVAAETAATAQSFDDQVSEIISGSKKRKSPAPRRSGYRRRSDPYSCKKILSSKMEDEYTWRKYGQKEIFNSKHPRHYFRCTHKYDRNCQATRQVQKNEQDPSLYEITYMGEHTCMDSNSSPSSKSTYIINFEATEATPVNNNIDDNIIINDSNGDTKPQLKQEISSDEEALSCLTPGTSSSNHQLLVFEGFPELDDATANALAEFDANGTAAFEQCDVTSSFNDFADALFNDDVFINSYRDMIN